MLLSITGDIKFGRNGQKIHCKDRFDKTWVVTEKESKKIDFYFG